MSLSGCLFEINTPAPTPIAVSVAATPTAALAQVVVETHTTAPPLPSVTSSSIPAAAASTSTLSPSLTAVPTTDATKPLLGRRIALDPGHGPRGDMGAVLVDEDTGKLVLAEHELNLNIALRVRDILVSRGAEVGMTRETQDEFTVPWPKDANGDGVEEGQSDDLQHRVDIMNAFGAEVFLSIHANSASNRATRRGIQVLYCANEDCAFPEQTKRLGRLVLGQLNSKLADAGYPIEKSELRSDFWADSPGEPPRHLFLLGPVEMPRHPRATKMPGVLVEAFYVTSPQEAEYLNSDGVRLTIAEAYANALQEYLTAGEE